MLEFLVTRFLIASCLLYFGPAIGYAEPTVKAKVSASVADIYAQPSFSSPVIDHLHFGNVVQMIDKKIVGQGGLGVFFKVKTADGKIGFITDSEVTTFIAPEPVTPAAISHSVTPSSLWGATVALVDYSEKLFGQTQSTPTLFYGLRRSGETQERWRLASDVNIGFSPTAPGFLDKVGAYGNTHGFVALGDFLLLVPFAAAKSFAAYFGLGPVVVYANYSTNVSSSPYTINEFRLGGIAELGYVHHFAGWALRADLQYYIETTMYPAGRVSLQWALP